MDNQSMDSSTSPCKQPPTADTTTMQTKPIPIVRSALGGLLMGLANLVPGVSGGTMIVVMGLYDDFINSIADVTRLRLTRKNILFLGIVSLAAGIAIASFSGTMSSLVILHRSAMFSLFIGMTLGGVLPLVHMLQRFSGLTVMGLVVGLGVMVAIAMTNDTSANREAMRERLESGATIELSANYTRDVVAGVLGMSAMVLPGISGAYMLLILGRYEIITGAVHVAKNLVIHQEGDLVGCLKILIPTAIGALASLVLVSNILKWLLCAHRELMLGLLIGVLLGSVVGIWPFTALSTTPDIGIGIGLAFSGFAATAMLSKLSA